MKQRMADKEDVLNLLDDVLCQLETTEQVLSVKINETLQTYRDAHREQANNIRLSLQEIKKVTIDVQPSHIQAEWKRSRGEMVLRTV